MSFFRNNLDLALLILRIGFGGMMLTHGIPKLQKMLSGDMGFADPIGIGETPSLVLTVLAEVVCAVMVLVGFKTKWAAIPLAFTMLVAGAIVHAADPFGDKEHSLLFLTGYLALALVGGGKYALDSVLSKKENEAL